MNINKKFEGTVSIIPDYTEWRADTERPVSTKCHSPTSGNMRLTSFVFLKLAPFTLGILQFLEN